MAASAARKMVWRRNERRLEKEEKDEWSGEMDFIGFMGLSQD